MLVLALDTTTRQGSASLARDGSLLGTDAGDPSVTHGVRLPGDLIRLLSSHGMRVADVDVFAVAAGPGSFTGLRVGIATQQGFALANNRPLIGVSALDAMNDAVCALSPKPVALSPDSEVAIWMDAQRGEVFSAVYSGDCVLEGPTVEKPVDILDRLRAGALRRPSTGSGRPELVEGRARPRVFAGNGALEYITMIQQAFPESPVVTDLPPLAPSIARLAVELLRKHGPVAPDAIRPIYVRRSDAELARERKVQLKLDPTI